MGRDSIGLLLKFKSALRGPGALGLVETLIESHPRFCLSDGFRAPANPTGSLRLCDLYLGFKVSGYVVTSRVQPCWFS